MDQQVPDRPHKTVHSSADLAVLIANIRPGRREFVGPSRWYMTFPDVGVGVKVKEARSGKVTGTVVVCGPAEKMIIRMIIKNWYTFSGR